MSAALPAIGAIAAITGAAVSVGASRANAAAQQAQARYQAAAAEQNAIIAEQKAADLRKNVLPQRLAQHERKVEQRIAMQRALLAANGVVVDQGTALDITTDTAVYGAIDALTIRNNAERAARDQEIEALNLRNQGGFARYRGRVARVQGSLDTLGSLATLGSTVADNWERLS